MVLALFGITLVSSAGVGLAYMVAERPIAEAKAAKITRSIGLVLPEFDKTEILKKETVDGGEVTIYTAVKGDKTVGYAIETFTNNGFSGLIQLMVGFLPDGTIYRVETILQNETPGLGDKIQPSKSNFSLQFEGKNPESFRLAVRKDGGDVDAITASTISSRAFSEAVERAYRVFLSVTDKTEE